MLGDPGSFGVPSLPCLQSFSVLPIFEMHYDGGLEQFLSRRGWHRGVKIMVAPSKASNPNPLWLDAATDAVGA
ncbi:hypothetical protein Sjap_003719 [Stephania japonica]|uniref:Uncharacterized protein n=1 Tax=Stephania japonica TaxID=461633 RepID=A0AAP0KRS6_9MAGN